LSQGNYYGTLIAAKPPAFSPVFTFKVRLGSRNSIGVALPPAFTPDLTFTVGSFPT